MADQVTIGNTMYYNARPDQERWRDNITAWRNTSISDEVENNTMESIKTTVDK